MTALFLVFLSDFNPRDTLNKRPIFDMFFKNKYICVIIIVQNLKHVLQKVTVIF